MLPEARGLEFLIIAAIAADFRTSFDEMAKQSELDDLRKQVEEMRAQASAATSDPMGLNSTMSEFEASMNADYGMATQTADLADPIVEEASPVRRKTTAKPKASTAKKPAAKSAAKAPAKPRATKAKS